MRKQLLRAYIAFQNLKNDQRGQDLIEYALMAGFMAVAASALVPSIAQNLQAIWSKVQATTAAAPNPIP